VMRMSGGVRVLRDSKNVPSMPPVIDDVSM
jgi:hypothetical protein